MGKVPTFWADALTWAKPAGVRVWHCLFSGLGQKCRRLPLDGEAPWHRDGRGIGAGMEARADGALVRGPTAAAGDSLGKPPSPAPRGPLRGVPRLGGLGLHGRQPKARAGPGLRRGPGASARRACLRRAGAGTGGGGGRGRTTLPRGGAAPGGRRRHQGRVRATLPCAGRRPVRGFADLRGGGDPRPDGRGAPPAVDLRSQWRPVRPGRRARLVRRRGDPPGGGGGGGARSPGRDARRDGRARLRRGRGRGRRRGTRRARHGGGGLRGGPGHRPGRPSRPRSGGPPGASAVGGPAAPQGRPRGRDDRQRRRPRRGTSARSTSTPGASRSAWSGPPK